MASIRTITRKNGTVAHKVMWREDGTQTSQTFDDPHEAARLKKFLDANGGRYALAVAAAMAHAGKGPTVADAVESHLASLSGLEERTPRDYEAIARLHIIPQLGARRLNELTRKDIVAWVNGLSKTGASPKSIANWHGLLSAVFSTAVEEKHIEANPCMGVKLPRRRKADDTDRFIELAEWDRFLNEEIPEHWQLLFRTLAGTGVRWSEVSAFRRRSLVGETLKVREAWKKAEGGWYIGAPKTDAGIRDIPIDGYLAEDLHRAAHGRDRDDWLLVSPRGLPLSYQSVRGKVWAPAVDRALESGIFPVHHKIHDLRHSHGSWLVQDGTDLPTVQNRLGHESIKTTIDVYGHLSQDGQRKAAEKLGALLPRPTSARRRKAA
jgi:integrase